MPVERCCLVIGMFFAVSSLSIGAEPNWSGQQIDFFEKHVRPVLAAQCWSCHGEKKAESGLRLDSREAILKGGDRGAAVTPTEAGASLLVQAIRRDGDLQMPPNGRLTPDQVAAFTTWIETGLPWPRESAGTAMTQAWNSHWAFQPVMRPAIPEPEDDGWSRTPIDRFISEQQRRNGNAGVTHRVHQQADRTVLIRRVTFDVTGLPPTPEEVAEFAADALPDAFERLLDRLLASPRYGERWGRYWLDVARFADTKGYVFFEEKSYPWASGYRDYVIQSLNQDKSYDQFLMEQIAADQMVQDGDPGALAAMGFLTVGSHFMGNVHDIVDDRIDVVSRGLMGLTVTCARCHDHKYDPIPTADYYSLYGVFRSSVEPLVPPMFAPPPDTPQYRQFTAELSVRQQALDDFIHLKRSAVMEGARTRVGEYLLAARAASENPATDDFMLIADPGELNPAMIVRWQAYLEKRSSVKPMESRDSSQTMMHPIWGPWFQLEAVPESRFQDEAARLRQGWTANVELRESNSRINRLVLKSLCADPPLQTLGEVANRYGDLMRSIHTHWQALLKDSVILKRSTPTELTDADEEELRLELYGESAPANVPLLFGWGFLSLLPDRASQAEYQKLLKEVENWLIHAPAAPPRAMVLLEGPAYEPRVFVRGNPNRLGPAVPKQFLSALDRHRTPFTSGSGRLELARAIVDPANPLTARVAVNRAWQRHFGAGLVRTPGDFGLRSDPPTHPALLDWLAAEFVGMDGTPVPDPSTSRSGSHRPRWSLKRLHRQMMSSAVYQQASGSAADSDPDNRWLTHANRSRLDFEATRDSLLFVTGRLDDRIGGPSQQLLDGGFQPRRTVYAYLDRQDPPGLLSVFDFPSPAATSPARDTTTVSPQALFLMNGPLAATSAQLILQRPDFVAMATTEDRVTGLYRILFGRDPRPIELQLAVQFLGAAPAAPRWQQFAQALLLTNEFVFVD